MENNVIVPLVKPLVISAEMHTIFILCGPSRCGKSSFALNLQEVIYNQYGLGSVVKLSSDYYRRTLLGYDYYEYCSIPMQETSEQAFKMLFSDLDSYTSYPVNTPFIIVDTTALSDTFRASVCEIARKKGYNTQIIMFDFPQSEYYKYLPEGQEYRYTDTVRMHIKTFKTKVLPNVRSKDYGKVLRVKSRPEVVEFKMLTESVSNTEIVVAGDDRVVIIGDIHEHTQALKDLVLKVESDYDFGDTKFALIGDYLDKGGDTKGIIDLVWTLMHTNSACMIKANHENYVVKRIKGEIEPNLELEAKSFSSVAFLVDPANKEYADKVLTIWNMSLPFLKIKRAGEHTVYVTHAPCKNEVIGKFSDYAEREQRNLRRYMKDDAREHYDFIFKEASYNQPIHVFGHVAHCAPKLNFKNKWFLDTGAVYGGKLSALVVHSTGEELVQVPCTKLFEYEEKSLRTDAVTPVQVVKEFKIYNYDLSEDDLKYVNRMHKSPIKYISGTMAPAASTDTEIESLEAGLMCFKESGVEQVILEPKYMGSRCQIYLFRNDPEKSFAVSRNGFIIKQEGIKKVLSDQYEYYTGEGFTDFWKESLIVDGEVMPWHFLGARLIDDDFNAYGNLILTELLTLDGDTELAKLNLHPELNLDTRMEHLNTFFQQLSLYGEPGEPCFKGFQVLSIDGREVVIELDQTTSFEVASEDDYAVLDLNSDDFLEYAREYMVSKVTEQKMEGIVIKPVKYTPSVAPYMKVRNEDYLHLIYGYDYKMRYEALSRKKRIGGKLATSIKEHELALDLLRDDGFRRTEILVKMVAELNKEKSLDPRL